MLENSFDRDLIVEMISNDDGITFATESTAAGIICDEITALPLEKPVAYHTYLAYPRTKEPEGIYKAFVEYVISGIQDLKETRNLKIENNKILY